MTELRYIGPHRPGATVPLPSGLEVEVAYGETAKFPTDIAQGLLEQETNWVRKNAPWGDVLEEPAEEESAPEEQITDKEVK